MKLTKKKGYEGTIRKVLNDEKTKVIGVVGTVCDLLAENLLIFIDGVSEGTWMFIPSSGKNAVFGGTRDAALFDVE